jgi:group I intron endonuclease
MLDTYKKEAGIYIFTNKISGKKYVGETLNLYNRIGGYKRLKKSKRYFEHAMIKNGFNSFDLEVFYYPNRSKEELLDLEELYIQVFDSIVPNGYNICPRGKDSTGIPKSPEHAAKVGLAHKGTKHSEETKRKISITKQNPSNETRKKISNATKGNTYRRLAIDQLTLEGEYIKTFPSITHAASETGCGITSINNMLCDRAKTSNGFKWRYSI